VSKIRQALNYEQALADAKLRAAHDLLAQATEYEHKLGDAKFHEIEVVQNSHTEFHDREHLLYEDAIEKASAALQASHAALQTEVERLADASANFMTTGRFEREHSQLLERVDAAFARVDEKLGAEERVTVQQNTRDEVLAQLTATRRWQTGLAVTVAISLIVTVLNWLKII
jgi:hypothetical protein